MTRLRARHAGRLKAPAWIAGIALLLWVVIGHGFANYDALYSLVWGQQLARGETPTYDLPVAPTPHPLGTLLGLALAPLGPAAGETVLVAIGFLALGALGYLVYRLGAEWFGPAAGLVAAAVILTREPVLSYGIRAYVDIPYIALVLAAVLVETRRPRSGAPVLGLLGVAGLLRPEAWLFSAAYWLSLAWPRGAIRGAGSPGRRELLGLAVLAAAAPVIWATADLLVTGNPLWSLTKTKHTAQTLHRVTGLANLPAAFPRRLGEVLREPVLFGAAAGGVAALAWLRPRARLGAVAGVAAVVAFAVLASAGLPIITRYVLLPAAILATFCGAGAFGWLVLAPEDRRRRWWIALGAVVLAALAAFVPSQVHRLSRTFDALGHQQVIEHDLVALVDNGAISLRCGPVAVPNHRPAALLALRLHTGPANVPDAQLSPPQRGVYVEPASAAVARAYILDPHDPHPLISRVPAGFRLSATNRSWRVFGSCSR